MLKNSAKSFRIISQHVNQHVLCSQFFFSQFKIMFTIFLSQFEIKFTIFFITIQNYVHNFFNTFQNYVHNFFFTIQNWELSWDLNWKHRRPMCFNYYMCSKSVDLLVFVYWFMCLDGMQYVMTWLFLFTVHSHHRHQFIVITVIGAIVTIYWVELMFFYWPIHRHHHH